ncbi:vWA domain-containing protein [Bifidobacterium canis]|uniref:VWFA domain-containing protein n=1 Tax=Bifidobacterium canis TaxID=2610880 RepID=A0A7K1J4Y5_9BIFI|nr:VWA domain-containing protein [Bifidobacterium canis]MUH59723.1 hypothetical protein [Bifidobacterium canis]
MNGVSFVPALGWIAGSVIAVLMVAFAVVGIVLHVRRGADGSDETLGSCIRRTAICLVVALMALTPSVVTKTTSRVTSATDVVIVSDITGSMGVEDAHYGSEQQISRLDAAKLAITDIVNAYPNSSFAALSTGASAAVDVPLTPDTGAVRNWADSLHTENSSNSAGSSLDVVIDPLLRTLKSIRDAHPDDRIVLYMVTDGEQTVSNTRRTFSSLRHYINDACVIGVGSTTGGKVPSSTAGQWVIDPSTGQPGVSIMDEGQIKALADELGGTALITSSTSTVANAQITKQAQQWRESDTQKERTRVNPVVWPLAILLVVLLAWEAGAWVAMSRRLL